MNKCKLEENELNNLNGIETNIEVQSLGNIYRKEFGYTDNHVTIYKNKIESLTLYKNKDCLSELNLNISKVDLGECYEKVKTKYIINNENLIIGVLSNKLGYKYLLFSPYNGEILNYQEICKNDIFEVKKSLYSNLNETKNDINSIKYLTSQNIDVFNLSNAFYNDICYHFDSPIDKDIALKDRVSLYYPNITLCENGCKTKGVNLTSFEAICECKINNLIGTDIFDKNILYQSSVGEIQDMISNTNIGVLKCYKDLFDKKYLFSSVGAYIILSLLLCLVILSIIYFIKYPFILKKYIFNKTEEYLSYLSVQNLQNKNNHNNSFGMFDNKTLKNPLKKKKKKYSCNNGKEVIIRKSRKSKTKCVKSNQINSNKAKKRFTFNGNNQSINWYFIHNNIENKNSDINNFKHNNDEFSPRSNDNIIKIKSSNNSYIHSAKEKQNNNNLNIKEYLSTDLDDLDYDDAVKKDNRTFCEYYSEKVKNNQIIINTFYLIDPLRPRPIKIILFILYIDLYFLVNGLFFNEQYVSEIFHSTKPEKFFTFIPRSIERFFYTTLVGVIVGYVIDFFFIEEKKIKKLFVREKDNLIILKYEINVIIKDIQIRNKLFISLSFIIISLTLYYVFCFNNIYPHMTGEWIKSSIMIFLIMQILSILAFIFETIFRFISFKCKNEKIYKLSLLFS